MFKMNKKQYADMYGPTTGDRVRLADTSLIIEVEKDYTVYGDEAKFGGGKSLRDGMGQCIHFYAAAAQNMTVLRHLLRTRA